MRVLQKHNIFTQIRKPCCCTQQCDMRAWSYPIGQELLEGTH